MQERMLGLMAAAHEVLAGLSVPVHGEVPRDAALPYVTLSAEMAPESGPGRARMALRVEIWSGYDGAVEALEIMAEIHARLAGRALPVAGVMAVPVWGGGRVGLDDSGLVRRGVPTYGVRVAAAAPRAEGAA